MAEPVITCPQCHSEIKLTDSLAAPLLESAKRETASLLAQKDALMVEKERHIREREQAVSRAQETVQQQVADQLRTERARIAAEESKKARLALAVDLDEKSAELTALRQALEQNNAKLAEAQRAQAELMIRQRQLDDARREMELTIQKQVQAGLENVRQQAGREAEERAALKLAESQQTISAMQKQIEDLRRRAEQGSQQLQGEVLELRLESMLRERFSFDQVQPVPKGEFGGDLLHRVIGPGGRICGTILWESKRTKNWTDTWLPKLRDDQRAAKADIAVIISQALPKGIDSFDHVDGIWISDIRCAIPVAVALRHALIEIAAARTASDGQQTKMELVYQYLTGPRFKQRIQAIVEKFTDMHEDLDKERKSMTRLWAKREEQIRGVLEATAGLYGDLQGIAGKSLEGIEGLSAPLLPDGSGH